MTAKTTDLMNETVEKYLSGKISYKEAIEIMYSIYLEDIKIIENNFQKENK